jgi:hypothetical protein
MWRRESVFLGRYVGHWTEDKAKGKVFEGHGID